MKTDYNVIRRIHGHAGEELPVWMNDWGTFNTMPEPWREISHDEYWHGNIYVHHAEEYRQVRLDRYPETHPDRERIAALLGVCGMCEVTICWGNEGAYAIVKPAFRAATKEERESNGGCPYRFSQPRYLHIGCKHEDVHVRQISACYNEYKCTKCGRSVNIDSSG
jgi:hypothetical protein